MTKDEALELLSPGRRNVSQVAIILQIARSTWYNYPEVLDQPVADQVLGAAFRLNRICVNPTIEAANAFWEYWDANGLTHRHGYYESTWGAINAAIAASGVITADG